MKRIILAMSSSRRDVGAKIEQGTRELINHLIKLWCYPGSQDTAKWRKEVAAKLNHVDRFKGSNRLPSSQFILDNSLRIWEAQLPNMLQYVIDDYGTPTDTRGYNSMRDNIRLYFNWIAEELAEYGQVSYTRIYTILEMYGF